MNPDSVRVVRSLAAKRDVPSFSFALTALTREPLTDEVLDTAAAVAEEFRNVRLGTDVDNDTSLRRPLEEFADYVGVGRYLEWCGVATWSPLHLRVWLQAAADQVRSVNEQSVGSFQAFWTRGDIDVDTSLWLAHHSCLVDEGAPPALAAPMLRLIGDLPAKHVTAHEAWTVVAAYLHDRDALIRVRDAVLARHDAHVSVLVGLFRILSASGDQVHVEKTGPYVEDAGAWVRVSRAVFTAQRIEGLIRTLEAKGISHVVAAHRVPAGDLAQDAQRIATDPQLHNGVARVLGSRESLFALGRLFTEKPVLASLRFLVGDHDAPVRLAAVETLGELGGTDATVYLETGLMDRNRNVRRSAQSALRRLVGEEAYAATIERLHGDVGKIRDELKESHSWAQQSLRSIQSTLTEAFDATKQAPGKLKDAASRFFSRRSVPEDG